MNDPWTNVPHDIVLCNFGGPTKAEEVEPFLIKLFEDPFIIRAPLPAKWRARLARRIARKRAPKSTAEYAEIGFSPINKTTEIQARYLEALVKAKRPAARVHVVNRYTSPFAEDVLKSIDLKTTRLFLLTMYPHLCHSTTVSSLRDFDQALERLHGEIRVPSTRVFSWWFNPRYVDLTWRRLQDGLVEAFSRGKGPYTVLFSAHGIPVRYHRRGDPYVIETNAHFTALKQKTAVWLSVYEGGKYAKLVDFVLSFQSRVGPVEWVKPYTDETIESLGPQKKGTLVVVPISFTSDHIETLFEMDRTYKELAMNSGFQEFVRVKPAGEDPELAQCLFEMLVQHGF
jgi:ferrochelatase